ncbi:uncharacterized protein LOC142153021 [Mixophyes fleayi]|uniref:uncharacterized protein LOC142153021 n=1 Tax=Mixophyes fleayi TaxID=3061075 RepID=UPI003F4DBE46
MMEGSCRESLTISILLLSSVPLICGRIVSGTEGQPVTLSCDYTVRTSSDITTMCWGRGSCPGSQCNDVLIWTDGHKVTQRSSPRYQLNDQIASGQISLTITQAQLEDAGTYCCRVEHKGWFNDKKLNIELSIAKATPPPPPVRTTPPPTPAQTTTPPPPPVRTTQPAQTTTPPPPPVRTTQPAQTTTLPPPPVRTTQPAKTTTPPPPPVRTTQPAKTTTPPPPPVRTTQPAKTTTPPPPPVRTTQPAQTTTLPPPPVTTTSLPPTPPARTTIFTTNPTIHITTEPERTFLATEFPTAVTAHGTRSLKPTEEYHSETEHFQDSSAEPYTTSPVQPANDFSTDDKDALAEPDITSSVQPASDFSNDGKGIVDLLQGNKTVQVKKESGVFLHVVIISVSILIILIVLVSLLVLKLRGKLRGQHMFSLYPNLELVTYAAEPLTEAPETDRAEVDEAEATETEDTSINKTKD